MRTLNPEHMSPTIHDPANTERDRANIGNAKIEVNHPLIAMTATDSYSGHERGPWPRRETVLCGPVYLLRHIYPLRWVPLG